MGAIYSIWNLLQFIWGGFSSSFARNIDHLTRI